MPAVHPAVRAIYLSVGGSTFNDCWSQRSISLRTQGENEMLNIAAQNKVAPSAIRTLPSVED